MSLNDFAIHMLAFYLGLIALVISLLMVGEIALLVSKYRRAKRVLNILSGEGK